MKIDDYGFIGIFIFLWIISLWFVTSSGNLILSVSLLVVLTILMIYNIRVYFGYGIENKTKEITQI
jgi:hypothetical protein